MTTTIKAERTRHTFICEVLRQH